VLVENGWHRALSDVSLQTEIYRNLAIPACLIIYVFQWIKKTSILSHVIHTAISEENLYYINLLDFTIDRG